MPSYDLIIIGAGIAGMTAALGAAKSGIEKILIIEEDSERIYEIKDLIHSVKIEISDNGIGIEKDKIDKIFEKFYQCEESHKKSGTGLGLSIVKRIIELLDGTIECRSEESIGTEMIVRITKS